MSIVIASGAKQSRLRSSDRHAPDAFGTRSDRQVNAVQSLYGVWDGQMQVDFILFSMV
jgi:hypothetical protein